jgi:hypothetical protein
LTAKERDQLVEGGGLRRDDDLWSEHLRRAHRVIHPQASTTEGSDSEFVVSGWRTVEGTRDVPTVNEDFDELKAQ